MLLIGLCVPGCPQGDVGAPCNHGLITPPDNPLVTFPALMCNDLLCVYGESNPPPEKPCASDADCNEQPGPAGFVCRVDDDDDGGNPSGQGRCVLDPEYLLARSMCSRRCSSDADCRDAGTARPLADDTACRKGFRCAQIQSLGDFCCQKLCVCDDGLADGALDDLARACADPDAACSE